MSKYLENLEAKRKELEDKIKKEKLIKIVKSGKLKFFEFTQNNSGGSFVVDGNLCHRLIIEAHSYSEARQKAMDLGVYFDGCDTGQDCNCCGDRWSDYDDSPIDLEKYMKEGYKTGYLKERKVNKISSIEDYAQLMANEYGWTTPDVRIFFYDGKVKEVSKEASS